MEERKKGRRIKNECRKKRREGSEKYMRERKTERERDTERHTDRQRGGGGGEKL